MTLENSIPISVAMGRPIELFSTTQTETVPYYERICIRNKMVHYAIYERAFIRTDIGKIMNTMNTVVECI